MPEIIKKIPVETHRRYQGSNTSDQTIAQILKSMGYSSKTIKKMKDEGRIGLLPSNLNTKVRGGQTLVVFEEYEKHDPDQELRNRFSNLETD